MTDFRSTYYSLSAFRGVEAIVHDVGTDSLSLSATIPVGSDTWTVRDVTADHMELHYGYTDSDSSQSLGATASNALGLYDTGWDTENSAGSHTHTNTVENDFYTGNQATWTSEGDTPASGSIFGDVFAFSDHESQSYELIWSTVSASGTQTFSASTTDQSVDWYSLSQSIGNASVLSYSRDLLTYTSHWEQAQESQSESGTADA